MDGNQAFGTLSVVGDIPLGTLHVESDQDRDARLAQETCLRSGIVDAMIAVIPAIVLLALQLPLPPGAVVTIYGTAILPLLTAVAVLGRGSTPIPFSTVGLFSVTALVGAYLCLLATRRASDGQLSDVWVAAMLTLAITPSYASLWAVWSYPSKSERHAPLPCASMGLVSIALVTMLAIFTLISATVPSLSVQPWILVLLYVASSAPPAIANWIQARRDKKLPVRMTDKQPDHISGVGATTFILFVVVIVTLGL